MCLLQDQLSDIGSEILAPQNVVYSLLRTCVDTAVNVIKTLRMLGDEELLGNFSRP